MNQDNQLDDLIEELLLAQERGDAAALARLTATYPEYEHQLTAYAVAGASLSAPLNADQLALAAAIDSPKLRDRALAAALGSQIEERVPAITGILARAATLGMDARRLAAATDLPRDVLVKLDRRLVAVTSVPYRCLAVLADALETSAGAVQSFLAGAPGTRVAAFNYASAPPMVDQQETFAAALASSSLATLEQQGAWRQALRDEGLA
jgi:hypothetical protein